MPDFTRGADYLLDRSFDIAATELPERARTVDGMVSDRERRLAYLLARDHYDGAGFIVDGGMFLGSSGVSLAEGLLANPAFGAGRLKLGDRAPIVGYELGVLPASGPNAKEFVAGSATVRFGESFVPLLIKNMEPYRQIVDVRIGDLLAQNWDQTDKISIIFIDVAKTPELNQHVFEQFFPCLIPGKSYIVQQDFFFDRLPWIKVLMGYLAGHFEWLGQVGPSAVYRYVARIPAAKFRVNPYRDLPPRERLRLHALADDPRLPDRRRFALDLSLAYLHAELNGPGAGMARLEEVVDRHSDYLYETAAGASAIKRVERARRSMRLALQRPPVGRAAGAVPPPSSTQPERAGVTPLAGLRAKLDNIIDLGQQALGQVDAIEKSMATRPGAEGTDYRDEF